LLVAIISTSVTASVIVNDDQFRDMDGTELNVILDVATAKRLSTAISATCCLELACLCVLSWLTSSQLFHGSWHKFFKMKLHKVRL
jgi:hypothetical protein